VKQTPTLYFRASGYAVFGMLLVLSWQWATVTVNHQGNWTALFNTGSVQGVPPALASEHIYQLPGSTGYDGQAYHYVAHDPFLRNADLKSFVDAPRVRYRRILVPGLAWLVAFGQAQWIDRTYILTILLWMGLGVAWSCELCAGFGLPMAGGLGFLLLPAALISIDRLVTDGALAALTAGFALYCKRPSWRLWPVLAAAALTRETGWFLIAGYCGYLAFERQWRPALRYSLACVPAAVWYLYVAHKTAPFHVVLEPMSFRGIWRTLAHPVKYPSGVPLLTLVQIGDQLALAGLLLAFAAALVLVFAYRCIEPECLTALCFAMMGIALQTLTLFAPLPATQAEWAHVYDFGRIYTPLLFLLAAQGLKRRSAIGLLPWLLLLPRIGMQLAPQVIHIFESAISTFTT
jgi:hypothetical protein